MSVRGCGYMPKLWNDVADFFFFCRNGRVSSHGSHFWKAGATNRQSSPHRVNTMQEIVPPSLSTETEKELLFFQEYLRS